MSEMKILKKTFIFALIFSVVACFAATVPSVARAEETVYDISEVVSLVGSRREYEMTVGAKNVGEKILAYGESVKFAYKERSDKNQYGHYSRTAFGIGSYGIYFYHTDGDIDVRTCNMQSSAKNWDRSGKGFTTIPDKTFKEYAEVTVKAELKSGDENTVVLTLSYPNGVVSKEFAKDADSDMLFRFGDHDVDGNFVKSLAPKSDDEAPVIKVEVSEFEVAAGSYPAENAFVVTDNSGEFKVSVAWSEGALDDLGRLTVGRHVCTITASDYDDNVATATITYVVNEEQPLTRYKVTFKADGKVVKEVYYTKEAIEYFAAPEVPLKEGYDGAWEDYELNFEDITVNAVYTAKGGGSESSEQSSEKPSDNSPKRGGCGSAAGGVPVLFGLTAAAFICVKSKSGKNRNDD